MKLKNLPGAGSSEDSESESLSISLPLLCTVDQLVNGGLTVLCPIITTSDHDITVSHVQYLSTMQILQCEVLTSGCSR